MSSKELGPAWQPAYIEAKLTLQAQKKGYFGTEDDLSEEDQEKVAELVALMTTEDLLKTYDTEAKRATLLGTNAQRVRTLKATKLYKDGLIHALQTHGLESVAQTMGTMRARAADVTDRQGVAAFDRLMRLGGVGQKEPSKFVKNVTNNTLNLTVDQHLQKFIAGRRGAPQVIDEVQAALPEGHDV